MDNRRKLDISDDGETSMQSGSFRDSEEFAASLCGYDVDLLQIERGHFKADVHQVQCGSVLFSHTATTRRLEVRGESPPGLMTFGIPTVRCEPFSWRRKTTDGGTIQIYRQSTELEMLSSTHFEANDLSMPASSLNALCETFGVADLDTLVGNTEMLRCDPKALSALRSALGHVDMLLKENPSLIDTPEIQGLIEVEIPSLLLTALLSSQPQRKSLSSPSKGYRCVNKVVEYIKASSHEHITLEDMCKQAGVSARTLQHHFKGQLNLTPKAYLQFQRLNNAHKKLFAASPSETRVADIANRCGFWHLGQFATDYRRHFGELPSDTLSKFGSFYR